MKKYYYTAALFFCIATMMGQGVLRKAEIHFRDLAYTQAAAEYEQYLEKEKNPKQEVLLHAAEANYYISNTGAAMRLYEKAYTQNKNLPAKDMRYYILALRGEEHYEQADALLWNYLATKDTILQNNKSQKEQLVELTQKGEKYKLDNLAVNTDKSDFGVVFFGKKVVYTSAKDTVRDGAKTYAWNQQPYLSLFVADLNADGTFGKEKVFLKNAQTDYHNAAVAFSPDLKTAYVSVNNVSKSNRLQNDKAGTNNVQIIYGRVSGERFDKKQPAPFNNADYSVGQPALSPDGKWLYFVSDMPGGYGETDIYYCEIYSDGKLGNPKNAGSVINTEGKEMFPFLKGDVLYFSSDGHYGLGGLDVFTSTVSGVGQFSLPQNMGKPVNSNRDDFAYVLSADGKLTYLSSNRAGGKGDDDIYLVTPKEDEPCVKTVKGSVTNTKDGSPIAAATVKAVKADGTVTTSVQTDAQGHYEFSIPCDESVTVIAEKPEYTTEQGVISADPVELDFKLTAYADLVTKKENAEMIDINPIYFDFDQYYITPLAAKELDKVVYVMEHFPNVVIKIESHTDSRGKDEYNLRLSDDRAKSTYSYIVSKGIDPKRIESVKGFGETRLLNKCSNGVQCSEEDHQLNRRSNFIIVKK
ncbi:OmpA family protein [Flavobacterium sp. RHBU_3]|uniref:OmpA family protein n=1 Tax=Flavobacterium sp. RHBU_3 TaxID=3391184 RepID=UPI00398509D8